MVVYIIVSTMHGHTNIRLLRHVRKIAKSDYKLCRVCPSVRRERLCAHWSNFNEI